MRHPHVPGNDRSVSEVLRDRVERLTRQAFDVRFPQLSRALRLLIPGGSRLLELDEVRARIVGFDQGALLHRWQHADPAMDVLASDALRIVNRGVKRKQSRREIFAQLCDLLNEPRLPENFDLLPRSAIPYMDEPWYC